MAVQEPAQLDRPMTPDGGAKLPAPPEAVKPPGGKARRPRPSPPRRRLISAAIAVNYWMLTQWMRFVRVQTIRINTINLDAIHRKGGYLLACTHLSHLEPLVIGQMFRRKIDWVSRLEFYWWPFSWVLHSMDCIPVNRQGASVSTFRTAIARLAEGRIIGIYPEGGVAIGGKFVCRNGPMKEGVCVMSQRAQAPIVPCVVLGTHQLNKIAPWFPFRHIPFRRTQLWVAYGDPIAPPPPDAPNRKAARRAQARELQEAFCRLYAQLRERYGIDDADIP